MEITAALVKQLRDMSGVAMMDCKKALVECEGDLDNALDLLRSNSALKAEKKASRIAADGILKTFVGEEYATIVEINSETDFAAKDSQFIGFADEVANFISKNVVEDISAIHESEIETKRNALVQSIGENIQIRRVETVKYESSVNTGLYIHSDSKLATVVVLPAPCKPHKRKIAGLLFKFNSWLSFPKIEVSSSLTILTICWPG
jgi:elongation factor Ts